MRRFSFAPVVRAAAAGLAIAAFASAAEARCQRLGFTVNDYGKDGPTRDAKAMLDTYIVRWAAENKVKTYTAGKKDVTCELFLDFGVFDEYTCKAATNVCWGGAAPATKSVAPPTTAAKAKS